MKGVLRATLNEVSKRCVFVCVCVFAFVCVFMSVLTMLERWPCGDGSCL